MRAETITVLSFDAGLGRELKLTAAERATLLRASAIAAQIRSRFVTSDDDDTLLAEIEHSCRDLATETLIVE